MHDQSFSQLIPLFRTKWYNNAMEDNELIIDEINEQEALERAREEGIEFVDRFEFADNDGNIQSFDNEEAASKAAKGKPVTQIRERK